MIHSISELPRRLAKTVVRAGAMATARWRQPPDLVIIGVKRGGTTSLFRDLELHPAMCPLVPSARRLPLRENQKGVHYFDSAWTRPNSWYLSHFPTRASRALTAKRHGSSFTAEASPYYLYSPLAARRTTAALDAALFVVLLRDPVERTVSHWAEQTRNGVEALSLADALDAEESRVGDAGERLASGAIEISDAHEQQSYAGQSEYAASLQRWIDLAGRDRLIVSFSEDYYRDPSSVIDPIIDRLGASPMPPDSVGGHRNAAPRPTEMDPDLEARLVARFRPDVEAVEALLDVTVPWPRFALQNPAGSVDDSL